MKMHIVQKTDILLPESPNPGTWSVIACDQFTSQKEYWEKVRNITADRPSALEFVLPEAWLDSPDAPNAPERIAAAMEKRLREGMFTEEKNCFIYLERTQSNGQIRRGLMAALDLECFEYTQTSRAPVRSTEGTVTERLPPRERIRAASPLEMPHVMVLMDDEENSVLGPLNAVKQEMKKLYDHDLMLDGGHVAGWRVDGDLAESVQAALDRLSEPEIQRSKYGQAAENGPLAFAVGDGNHSLAAAKRWWDRLRETLDPEDRSSHPARYALVELVNLYDDALTFQPIHRLILDTDDSDMGEMISRHSHTWADPGLSVGERVDAADRFCREYITRHGGRVDYIHGNEAARLLGSRPGCGAVLLPPVDKNRLFLSVLTHGALPRKSFSMGGAADKRYYFECRRIK